jgi:DNA-binding winged helix-turn-helix (wHTH) protein
VNEAVPPSDSGPKEAIALAKRDDFQLGKTTVRPSLRTIEGPSGTTTGEPRVVRVLIALADARGAVLSRDDLLRLCWDGRIVGDDAINRAIAEVRRIAAEVGADFEVETVRRIGYRISGVDWDRQADPGEALARARAIGRRTLIAGGAAAVAAVAGGVAAFAYRSRRRDIDDLIERGRVLQASGDPSDEKRAEALFREALSRESGRADAWGWLAVVSKDYSRAREAAVRALQLDPKEPNARAVLAYQQRDFDAWTRWEDALLAVLGDAPDNAYALNQLAFFYQGMGRCRDSWNVNERAIRAEPFNSTPQHRRAYKHWIFGRVPEADKIADQGLRLWPRSPYLWNARMLIYACTGRAEAALALLDDTASRPANLTAPSIESWRAALDAIASRSAGDIARAEEVCTRAARLAPGLAANAIMLLSYLGSLDASYRVASGLFESRGPLVQTSRGKGIRDLYSEEAWGRTQFLFIPATANFRNDSRFPGLCQRIGHVDYWRKRGIWPDPFVRGSLDPAEFA